MEGETVGLSEDEGVAYTSEGMSGYDGQSGLLQLSAASHVLEAASAAPLNPPSLLPASYGYDGPSVHGVEEQRAGARFVHNLLAERRRQEYLEAQDLAEEQGVPPLRSAPMRQRMRFCAPIGEPSDDEDDDDDDDEGNFTEEEEYFSSDEEGVDGFDASSDELIPAPARMELDISTLLAANRALEASEATLPRQDRMAVWDCANTLLQLDHEHTVALSESAQMRNRSLADQLAASRLRVAAETRAREKARQAAAAKEAERIHRLHEQATQFVSEDISKLRAAHKQREMQQRQWIQEVQAAEQQEAERRRQEELRRLEEERKQREREEMERREREKAERAAREAEEAEQARRDAAQGAAARAERIVFGGMALARRDAEAVREKLAGIKQAAEAFGADKSNRQRMPLLKLVRGSLTQTAAKLQSVQLQASKLIDAIKRARASKNKPLACYVINLFAKELVKKGEKPVSSKPEHAWPLAMVGAHVLSANDGLINLVKLHFHTVCVFTVPYYPTKADVKTQDELREVMGYRRVGADWEPEEAFFNRLSGYMRLYAALLTFADFDACWTWIARICNVPPISVTATCLFAFLDVATFVMLQRYGSQMMKLLLFVRDNFVPRLDDSTPARKQARDRLRIYLAELSKGIQPSKGSQLQ